MAPRAIFMTLVMLVGSAAQNAAADGRVALVVGNEQYGEDVGRLENTANDARLIADTLTGLGFEVDLVIDAKRETFREAIRQYGRKLREAGADAIGVFYYAGHGFQLHGENFLMPVDGQAQSEAEAESTNIPADELMREIGKADDAAKLVFLNTCRNNLTVSKNQGLAQPVAPTGTFIGYSTAPNALAWSGAGKYSPYARALAREIAEPAQSIAAAHMDVRRAVIKATGGQQVPWESSSLTRDIVLASVGPNQTEQAKRPQLWFYNWTNYFPPDLLDTFTDETGIDVTMDGYDSNEALQAALQANSGAYDVVVPSDYMVELLAREGLLKQIDATTLPNWPNVRPEFQRPAYDPKRKYTVPYMWGTTGLSYDAAQVSGGKLDESWAEFFRPRKELEGKIASLDDQVELYNAAAYYLGIDKCTENPGESEKILALLMAQKPKLAIYSSEDTIERMSAGAVAVHLQWNGAAHRTKESRNTVQYLYPKEGVGFWQDAVAIPRNAPHPESAKIFLNWLLKPEVAAAITNYSGYMNAIDEAAQFVDARIKNDPAVNMPSSYFPRLRQTQLCSPAARYLRDAAWQRLRT